MEDREIKKDAAYYQKLAKKIYRFEPMVDRIITVDTIEPKVRNMDYDTVINLAPDDQRWITVSQVYFNEPQYQRIILYYATLYLYYYYIAPIGVSKGVDKKKLEKEFRENLDFLDDEINVENFCLSAVVNVLTEGTVFYYYDWENIDGEIIFRMYKMPREFCTIIGIAKNEQLPIYQCDVSFIQDIINALKARSIRMTEEEVLNQYPEEIRRAYMGWRKNNGTRYVTVTPAHGVAFSSYNGLPPFAQTLRQILRMRKFENVRDEYLDTALQKILFQHVDVDDQGNPEIDLALAAEFHANLKKITKDIPRLNAFTSLADVEVLDLNDVNTKQDLDFIANFTKKYYDETGVPQEIFQATTAGTLEYAALKDEGFMWGILKQIEIWFSFILNAEIGARKKKSYNFVFSFLPVSYRNREKMMDSYLKNAQYGYSKMMPQIAIGVKQRHFESLLYLENDLLKLDERLVPLMSSHTMSGKESEALSKAGKVNGRPKSENTEKTDGTLAKDASK